MNFIASHGRVLKLGGQIGGYVCAILLMAQALAASSAEPITVTAVSAGFNFSLAIKSDGSLWSWGRGGSGQLGDGSPILFDQQSRSGNRASPVQIGSGFHSIAAGYTHALALKSDGSLWVWGSNKSGELGDGTTTSQTRPVQVAAGFSAISAGRSHTLALKPDGSLWAWGSNAFGQLGDGTTTARLIPALVGTGYSALAAGENFSVAIKTDGRLWAWGDNRLGQLGDGTTTSRLSPTRIDSAYRKVAAAGKLVVALKADGSLWSWGSGPLGDGSNVTMRTLPTRIGSGYSEIAAGDYHAAAIKPDGSLWAWGRRGLVGDGTDKDQDIPTQIGGGYTQIAIHTGVIEDDKGLYGHSLAIRQGGSVWAWGNASYGELGLSSVIRDKPFTQIGNGFVSIAAGGDGFSGNSNFAVKTDGSLWGWGMNRSGQLGDGTTTSRILPFQIGIGYQAVAAGSDHNLGLKLDGSLWEWGKDIAKTPTRIGEGFSAIAAGNAFSLALKPDGNVWQWQGSGAGKLGDASTPGSAMLPWVGEGYTAIATGYNHNLGLKADGSLWGWGGNEYGQVGDGTRINRTSPVMIGSGYSAIAAGGGAYIFVDRYALSMALKPDGSLWTWGGGGFDFMFPDRLIPTQIVGSYRAISAGGNSMTALKPDGSVIFVSRSNDPSNKVGAGFSVIEDGAFQTIALRPDGGLWVTDFEVPTRPANTVPGRVFIGEEPDARFECVVDWAQVVYPDLFAPANFDSRFISGTFQRSFAQSGSTLLTNGEQLYYQGQGNNAPIHLGAINRWTEQAGCAGS